MEISHPNVAVLIPAAGSGERMGGRRKQFRMLDGEPLLVRTLRAFDRHPRVSLLVVAAPKDDVTRLASEFRETGITTAVVTVGGGRTRQESVAAALDAVPDDVGIVLVHDAVRPFLPSDRIDAVIDAVISHGAAALAVPAGDTLRRGDDAVFGETVSRRGLYRMQTPQGFRKDWFQEANRQARAAGAEETDDVALVQMLGHQVRIVEGSQANIKVTTPDDWLIAEALSRRLKEDASPPTMTP